MEGAGGLVAEVSGRATGGVDKFAVKVPTQGAVINALMSLAALADQDPVGSFDEECVGRSADTPPDYFSAEVQSKMCPSMRAASREEIPHQPPPRPQYLKGDFRGLPRNYGTADMVIPPRFGSGPMFASLSESDSIAESFEVGWPSPTVRPSMSPDSCSPERTPMGTHKPTSCESSIAESDVPRIFYSTEGGLGSTHKAMPAARKRHPEITENDPELSTKEPEVVTPAPQVVTECILSPLKFRRVLNLIGLYEIATDAPPKAIPPAASFSEEPIERSGIPRRQNTGNFNPSRAPKRLSKPRNPYPKPSAGAPRRPTIHPVTSDNRSSGSSAASPILKGGLGTSHDIVGPTPSCFDPHSGSVVPDVSKLTFSRAAARTARNGYRVHPGSSLSPRSLLLASIEKPPLPTWPSTSTKATSSTSIASDPSIMLKSVTHLPRPSSLPRDSRRSSARSSPASTPRPRAPFPLSLLAPRVPVDLDIAGSSDGETDTSELSVSSGSSPAKRSDGEPEADVEVERVAPVATVLEERADNRTVGSRMGSGSMVTSARVAEAESGAVGIVADREPRVVLPCGPSDEEKVLYEKSGRALLVTTGVVAFVVLTGGMWLYTTSSPFFWWYGAPTIFFTVYMCCQYFGVAIWGKDFKVEEHKEVVQKATDEEFTPTVDVFLPVCNEPTHVLANTWKHIMELDYPHVKVHVLDDGAKDEVLALAQQFGFEYIRRTNRPELKKAGNLRYAFTRTSGEVILILDADFCPRPDFLRETLPYFVDPTIGIVQTPQFFRRREEQTWVEQGAGVSQEFFYRMVQVNQNTFDGSCCCGSCAVYRRSALESLGGMAAIEHSEDLYTGFKLSELGYKLRYIPLNMAMGTCPDEPRSFFMQQYRWCMGTLTLVLHKDFWQADVPRILKFCMFNGMMYYTATALLIFLGPLPILLLVWLSPEQLKWYHTVFVLPAIIFMAIIVPYWSSQKYGLAGHRVRIIQCYAHVFAIKDRIMGTAAAWVPSGGGAQRSSSKAYESSVWLLILYNTLITILILGGAAWRMMTFDWYHFAPCMVLAIISYVLNLSTLWGF